MEQGREHSRLFDRQIEPGPEVFIHCYPALLCDAAPDSLHLSLGVIGDYTAHMLADHDPFAERHPAHVAVVLFDPVADSLVVRQAVGEPPGSYGLTQRHRFGQLVEQVAGQGSPAAPRPRNDDVPLVLITPPAFTPSPQRSSRPGYKVSPVQTLPPAVRSNGRRCRPTPMIDDPDPKRERTSGQAVRLAFLLDRWDGVSFAPRAEPAEDLVDFLRDHGVFGSERGLAGEVREGVADLPAQGARQDRNLVLQRLHPAGKLRHILLGLPQPRVGVPQAAGHEPPEDLRALFVVPADVLLLLGGDTLE